LGEIRISLNEKKEILEKISKEEKRLEKRISSVDICPLCRSKITKEHLDFIRNDVNSKNSILEEEIEKSDKNLIQIEQKKKALHSEIDSLNSELSKREYDLIKISNINDKKEQIKLLQEKIEIIKKEISEDEKEGNFLENKFNEISNIEQRYESARIDIQEISSRNKETIDSEMSFKIRELERLKIQIKQFGRDKDNFKEDLEDIRKKLKIKEELLEDKKKKEEDLSKKFSELIKERDSYNSKIRELELNQSENKNKIYNIEQKINDLKIERAKVNAEIENFETEMLDYDEIQIIKGKRSYLSEKLSNLQSSIDKIGSVNMRSLEVYDSIKWAQNVKSKPVCIVCHTIKGKGISFMENKIEWHAIAKQDMLKQALVELKNKF